MITDAQCNKVYVSSMLHDRHPLIYDQLSSIVNDYGYDFNQIYGTKDIWCRDYMPIQVSKEKFHQFQFDPSYLFGYEDLKTNTAQIEIQDVIHSEKQILKLDGGNVIRSKNKVILTERIFKENHELSPIEICATLEEIFKCQVGFVADIEADLTGHIDGYVRFVDDQTVLVNALDKEYKFWVESFHTLVRELDLEYIEVPWFMDKKKDSAVGNYINYCEVGNLIILPAYGHSLDLEVLEILSGVFPDKTIELVKCDELAAQGGVLNCVSWNIFN